MKLNVWEECLSGEERVSYVCPRRREELKGGRHVCYKLRE